MQECENFKKLIDNNVEQMMVQLEIYTDAEKFIDKLYSTPNENSKKIARKKICNRQSGF